MPNPATNKPILLKTPAPGKRLFYGDLAGSVLIVDFDPNGVAVEQSGNDAVLLFPSGGSITLAGFMDDQLSPPPEVIAAGGVKVESAQELGLAQWLEALLEYHGEAVDGSGVGQYQDNPGDLLNGVDRLGMLSPFYWGSGLGKKREDQGEEGGAARAASISFNGEVYEDDYSNQYLVLHRYIDKLDTGYPIEINFTPGAGESITSIYLSGFPAGSKVFIGDPNSRAGQLITLDENGGHTFEYSDFTTRMVYVEPPQDDDADIPLQYLVTLSNGQTLSGSFTIIVDAVADKPDNVTIADVAGTLAGYIEVQDADTGRNYENGWQVKDVEKNADNTGDANLSYSVSATVSAQFYDYLDGSEEHMFYIEVPPGWGWSCTVNGVTLETVNDLPGSIAAHFKVPQELISFTDGFGTANIVLTCNDPDGNGRLGIEQQLNLRVLAVAHEKNLSGEEIRTDNNITETMQETWLQIDTIGSKVQIRTGWVSEGGNGAKNLGGIPAGYDPANALPDYAGATQQGQYANISVVLDAPGDPDAPDESINRIEITYDATKGTLVDATGVPLTGTGSQTSYTVVLDGGFISADGQSLVPGSVKFQPNANVSDADLNDLFTIKVSVESTNGAGAQFTAKSGIVVDAVADQPIIGSQPEVDYGGAYTEASPGSTVTVSGSIEFSDLDGSELLYALICIPESAFRPDFITRDILLDANAIQNLWREKGNMPPEAGGNALDKALNAVFDPGLTGGSPNAYANQYLLMEYDPLDGTVKFYTQGEGGTAQEVNLPGMSFSKDPNSGELTYSFNVVTPSAQEDASVNISVIGVSLEKAGNEREYDYSNNISASPSAGVVPVEVVSLKGVLKVSMDMHEDAHPNQNVPDRNGSAPSTDPADPAFDPDFNQVTGRMPISMSLDNASPGEYVSKITIGDVPADGEGAIYYNGTKLSGGEVFTYPGLDLNGFSYEPGPNYSGNPAFDFSYATSSTSIGPVSSPARTVEDFLRVDSVADLADAKSESTDGRMQDGAVQNVGNTQDDGYESGWNKQSAQAEDSYTVKFTITASFKDLDGSEEGWVEVLLPDGFSLPPGSVIPTFTDSTGTWARVKYVSAADMEDSGKPGYAGNPGEFEIDVELIMDQNAARSGDKKLQIRTVSHETDGLDTDGHSAANNTASRIIYQDVPFSLFQGGLTVEAGFAYEGNKYGGSASSGTELENHGYDHTATLADGAPLNFTLAQGEFEDDCVLTVSPATAGVICVDGVPQTPTGSGQYTLTADQMNGGRITFRPDNAPLNDASFRDDDVQINYSLKITDDAGSHYQISGTATVVVDAVADAGSFDGTDAAADTTPGYEGNMLVTFSNVYFPDASDSSEKHYLLVEALQGWGCEGNPPTKIFYFDAAGNALRPTGYDETLQEYTYDLSQAASSRTFFLIDISNLTFEFGPEEIPISLIPPANAADVTLATGTLSVEQHHASSTPEKEYDLANNVALNLNETLINFADSGLVASVSYGYEDGEPNQNTGDLSVNQNTGLLVVNIKNDDAYGGNDYIDITSGVFITVTFDCANAPAHMGSFYLNGSNQALSSGYLSELSPGKYELKIPTNTEIQSSESTKFYLRYEPKSDDDTDLTNIVFSVPIYANGTSADRYATNGGDPATNPNYKYLDLIVDAVADKPTGVSITPEAYGGPHTAFPSGDTIEVTIEATFGDYDDGSETHYLIFDLNSGFKSIDTTALPPGCTKIDADMLPPELSSYANASRYVVIEVDNGTLASSGGHFSEHFTVILDAVTKDSTLNLDFTAVAVETNPTDAEISTSNNLASTPGRVAVHVNAVTSNPVLKPGVAYENDTWHAHNDEVPTTPDSYFQISGLASREALTSLEITYEDGHGTMYFGTYAINSQSAGSHNEGDYTISYTYDGSKYTITLTSSGSNNDAAGGVPEFHFKPTQDYKDADLNLAVKYEVTDTASGLTKLFPASGTSSVTLVVDAVAQQPLNADTDIAYPDPVAGDPAYTAAYDKMTVTTQANFRDTGDGSEKHYLLIEAKDYFNTGGLGTVTSYDTGVDPALIKIAYDADGNPLTQSKTNTGIWLRPGDSTNIATSDNAAQVASIKTFVRIPVDDAIAGYNTGTGGSQTITANGLTFTVTRESNGSYTVKHSTEVGIKTGGITKDLPNETLITGGMSVEHAGGGSEAYQYNNVGYGLQNETFKVSVVETKAVSVLMGDAFESDNATGNTATPTVGNGAGILVVRDVPQLTTDYDNEVISVTFTYDSLYKDTATNQWVKPGSIVYGGALPAGASLVESVDANGKVTVTLTLPPTEADSVYSRLSGTADPDEDAVNGSKIRFVPNENSYNEGDVRLSYTVTVRDAASGASAPKGSGTETVVIDAVANLPVISLAEWDYQGDNFTASSSAAVNLLMTVTFPDTGTNGIISEGQYILVQQTTGMMVDPAFLQDVTTKGYAVNTYPSGGNTFYRIPAAYFQSDSNGVHQIKIPMLLQGGMRDITNVDAPIVMAQSVVENIHGGELDINNNNATATAPLDALNFAVVNSAATGGIAYTFEDNTPNAYLGDPTPGVGAAVSLGIHVGGSPNGQESISAIKIEYDTARGDLYLRSDLNNPIPNEGTISLADKDNLVFIPKNTGKSDSDLDVNIKYSFTATEPATGESKNMTSNFLVVIDAVAERPVDPAMPDPVVYQGDNKVDYGETVTIKAQATFPDFAKSGDGHADHYFLLQKPSENWTVENAGADSYTYNGVSYFRIPVPAGSYGAGGTVSLDIILKAPDSGRLLYENSDPIKLLALTIDRDPAKGPLPSGDRGLSYDNNYAYSDTVDVPLAYGDQGMNYLTIDTMYENNTPAGNTLLPDGNPDNTQAGGKVHLPPTITVPNASGGTTTETVSQVTLTWTSGRTILVDGNGNPVPLTHNPDGTVSVTIPQGNLGNSYYFRTDDPYSDADGPAVTATITTTQGNTYTDRETPVVDAVAQVPTDVSAEAEYGTRPDGGAYTAASPNTPVSIEVSATFSDLDGSEDHFVLVEAKPNWSNPEGYNVIQGPDGKTYYQVPVDPADIAPDGSVTTTVKVYPSGEGGTAGEDGKVHYSLGTGAMSREREDSPINNGIPRGDEPRSDNNTAYNFSSGQVVFTVSGAESNPALNVTPAYAGGDTNGSGQSGPSGWSSLSVSGLNTSSDGVSQVTLTFNGQNGGLVYNGSPISGMSGVSVTNLGNGQVQVSITNSELLNALCTGGGVYYKPSNYNDADVSIKADITVNDLFSPDTKQSGNTATIMVDAVARQPQNTSVTFVGEGDDASAIIPGHEVTIQATASFPGLDDTSDNATHYLAIEEDSDWKLPGGELPDGVAIATHDGVNYYVIDVDKYKDTGHPLLTRNADGSYTFSLKLTAPNSDVDVANSGKLLGGAVTVVETIRGDEVTYKNNSSVVAKELPLSLGVVETEAVNFSIAPVTEASNAGSAISLSQDQLNTLTSNNEKLTGTSLTFSDDTGHSFDGKTPGQQVGTVVYDGKVYAVRMTAEGTAEVDIDFGSGGFDPGKEFNLVWGTVASDANGNAEYMSGPGSGYVVNPGDWNYTGGNMKVDANTTVQDKASNDSKVVDSTGPSDLDYTGTAQQPAGATATDPARAVGSGQAVTFTASATFPDVDGSEQHFILVEKKDGWSGDYHTMFQDNTEYFMVPVSGTASPASATVKLTTPEGLNADASESLAIRAVAVDGGSSAVSELASAGSVTVNIGVVADTTSLGLSLASASIDENESTQITFNFTDGDGSDQLKSITITDLQGGSIVDSTGNTVYFSGTPATLDLTLATGGGYYYKPPSYADGSFSFSYSAVVTDKNSGASKIFSGSSDALTVTGVANAPQDSSLDGSASGLSGTSLAQVTLQADFPDNDGSETHFFLVQLPASWAGGPPNGWAAIDPNDYGNPAGIDNTWYRVNADASGSAVFTLDMAGQSGAQNITYVAGTFENSQGAAQSAFSGQDTVNVPYGSPFARSFSLFSAGLEDAETSGLALINEESEAGGEGMFRMAGPCPEGVLNLMLDASDNSLLDLFSGGEAALAGTERLAAGPEFTAGLMGAQIQAEAGQPEQFYDPAFTQQSAFEQFDAMLALERMRLDSGG